jgi:hypothetical protein
VAEVRIYPASNSKRPRPGCWLTPDGIPPIPQGGVSTRLLRRINLGMRLKFGPRALDFLASELRGVAEVPTITPAPRRQSGARRGRKGRPPEFYARVAVEYERALQRDARRPLQIVARQLALPSTTRARDVVYQARRLGLLTLAEGHGIVGGEPTPEARALLRLERSRDNRRRIRPEPQARRRVGYSLSRLRRQPVPKKPAKKRRR